MKIITERGHWQEILKSFKTYDFYHTFEYHRIDCAREGGSPHLFVYDGNSGSVALPLVVRPIPIGEVPYFDATSVYGYSGPLLSCPAMTAEDIRDFQRGLVKCLRQLNVITVFSRLHPILKGYDIVSGLGECVIAGTTVSIDLEQPEERQTEQYRANTRREVARLRQARVVCEPTDNASDLEEFVGIYTESMGRLGASAFYYFSDDYFREMVSADDFELRLFVCRLEGNIICGGLFSFCNGIIQYHLSGTKTAYTRLSPTRLLIDTVRKYGATRGDSVLHLGGGIGGRESGLLSFKKGFSKARNDFCVWKWVVNDGVYERLCERIGTEAENGRTSGAYFPEYRHTRS